MRRSDESRRKLLMRTIGKKGREIVTSVTWYT